MSGVLLQGRAAGLLVLAAAGLTACGEDPVPTDLGQRVARLPQAPSELVWGPDGHTLFATTRTPPTITRIDRRGEVGVLLRSAVSLDQLMLAPDGRSLLVRQGRFLMGVPLDGARPEDLFVPASGLAVVRAFFTRDGERLAVVAGTPDGATATTTVLVAATRQTVLERSGEAWTFSPAGDRLLFVSEEPQPDQGRRLRAASVPLAGGAEQEEGVEAIGPDEQLIRVEWRTLDVYLFIAGTYRVPGLINVGLRLRGIKRQWSTLYTFISDARIFERRYYFDLERDQLATWSWSCFGTPYGADVDPSCSRREHTLHLMTVPIPEEGLVGGRTVTNTQVGSSAAPGPVAFRGRDMAVAAPDLFILEGRGF